MGGRVNRMDGVMAEGHPADGHQCYSKALAAVGGYPVGDVRPPLTTFAELGAEGTGRVAKIKVYMDELDRLMDEIDGPRSSVQAAE